MFNIEDETTKHFVLHILSSTRLFEQLLSVTQILDKLVDCV